MPIEFRDPAYLFDMVEVGKKILVYIQQKNYEDFLRDDLLKDAIERNLTIFGEAARKLSEQFKGENPDIPWRRIIGLRNILVHEYEDIDYDEIWEIITIHLPILVLRLEALMPPIPSDIED
jgi:uncharacterized protein with HEPN domain